MSADHEKRQFPRYLVAPHFHIRMRPGSEEKLEPGRVINVSKRGLYVESKNRFALGQNLEVELYEQEDSARHWLSAIVRRVERTWDPERGVPIWGLGLELSPLSPEETDFLSSLIKSVRLSGPCEKTVLSSVEGRQLITKGVATYRAQLEHQEDEAGRDSRRIFKTEKTLDASQETSKGDEGSPIHESSGIP